MLPVPGPATQLTNSCLILCLATHCFALFLSPLPLCFEYPHAFTLWFPSIPFPILSSLSSFPYINFLLIMLSISITLFKVQKIFCLFYYLKMPIRSIYFVYCVNPQASLAPSLLPIPAMLTNQGPHILDSAFQNIIFILSTIFLTCVNITLCDIFATTLVLI